MDTDGKLGPLGEKLAARFLKSRGYRILPRNYVTSVGEVDLVAREGDVLVFVEVKTRTTDDFGGPLLGVHRAKQRKLGLLARTYIAQKKLDEVPCRFDVVGILLGDNEKDPEIELIRDAFPLRRR